MFSRLANVLNRVFGFPPAHRRGRRRKAPGRSRPALVALEDRCLLSSYTITEIGASSPSGSNSMPTPGSGINNASVTQVVGFSASSGHAYLWDSMHGMHDLGTLKNEAQSAAVGINNAGQVVGRSWTTQEIVKKGGYYYLKTTEDGFLWSSSTGLKDLGSDISPTGINRSGEVSGIDGASSPVQASLWNGGKWLALGNLPGGVDSIAYGINDYGQVVGYCTDDNTFRQAFLWTPSNPNGTGGSMIDLGSFDTSYGMSYGTAINGQGWITGQAWSGDYYNGAGHAFLWKPSSPNGTAGTMIDLGTLDPTVLGGNGQSWGLAINSSGVVVGLSNPTSATQQDPRTDAVIWQPGSNGTYALSDLNNLIPSGSGWTLFRADAINDSGQIVVEAQNSSLSGLYALLLTPSAPAPLALSAAAAPPSERVAVAAPVPGPGANRWTGLPPVPAPLAPSAAAAPPSDRVAVAPPVPGPGANRWTDLPPVPRQQPPCPAESNGPGPGSWATPTAGFGNPSGRQPASNGGAVAHVATRARAADLADRLFADWDAGLFSDAWENAFAMGRRS
jgi:probable HAF family extracellular repeat protein